MKKLYKSITQAVPIICITYLAGCGFSPPKEYHNVERAIPADYQIEGNRIDAGAEADSGESVAPSSGGEIYLGVGLSAIQTLPLSQLLAKSQNTVEAIFVPVEPATKEEKNALKEAAKAGWVKYSAHLRVRYLDNVAVEMEQRVPDGLSCIDAAKWLGFKNAKTPASEDNKECKWPVDDTAHSLDKGIYGSMSKHNALFNALTTPLPQIK